MRRFRHVHRSVVARCLRAGVIASAAVVTLGACQSLASVDRDTNAALRASAERIGEVSALPQLEATRYEAGDAFAPTRENADAPPTRNPPNDSLHLDARQGPVAAEEVIRRFNAMVDAPPDAPLLGFTESVRYAQVHASEYLAAEEAYLISGLRLLIEQHRWGPRFFDDVGTTVTADADSSGRYTTALNVFNDLRVTQRLPYGGEVSARFLTIATQQLDEAVGGSSQSADILLAANIPLLRGAGTAAREPLTQARRELVYAARAFQLFRREFYVDVARDYFTLVFQKQQITNAERQVERSRQVEARTIALVDSGRTEPFQSDLARQNTFFAIDRLAQLKESYRLSVDRFKVRIGMSTEEPIEIAQEVPKLPVPDVKLDEAVRIALDFRLDVQTQDDRVEDFRRAVDVAKNNVKGDLTLALSADIPTEGTRVRSGLQFRPGQTDFLAGLTYSLPLDRTIEKASLRETQIRLEQQKRTTRLFRDNVAVDARQSVRAIEKARFSLLIAEKNVSASNNRLAAIEAAIDRATARDRTEAVNNLQRAQDDLERAKRDLQIAILEHLQATGQLRVAPDGLLLPPPGLDETATP